MTWTSLETPLGTMRVVADDSGITAAEFLGLDPNASGERTSTSRAAAASALRALGDRDDRQPILAEAVRQFAAYFRRELKQFELPLSPVGTPFQLTVWAHLRGIEYGETASYGEIARRMGLAAGASRAVGAANGRNPIAIIVPCHRVVGSTGKLTGYAGGMDRKRFLLELEGCSLF